MTHENEYPEYYVDMLELIWGDGYMAPGGPGNVARLLDGIPTQGARILDIGCGIGGPAFEMATTHGADVVGIDLELPLIERAQADAEKHGLADRCTFVHVELGPLQFDDETFEIVISSGALTQTADKSGILADVKRILRPGGFFSCYDWLRSGEPYTDDMQEWFRLEGLTYALETLDSYQAIIRDAGYENVTATDATDWYRAESRREYELMVGPLNNKMTEILGQEHAEHFVENWRVMVKVIEQGEMRQGYLRGQKPE